MVRIPEGENRKRSVENEEMEQGCDQGQHGRYVGVEWMLGALLSVSVFQTLPPSAPASPRTRTASLTVLRALTSWRPASARARV